LVAPIAESALPSLFDRLVEISARVGFSTLASEQEPQASSASRVTAGARVLHKIDGDELLACITGKKTVTNDLQAK
jgi:hypothetical protein